ncbi:MAG: hypothetical protein PHP31_07605 [Lentimicrobiaceae bacterium]|nr:hypothetical protein [Lentimicrobiaceae bacterium]
MENLENFNQILEANNFEVSELLRQLNIINLGNETLLEMCYRAYQKEGNSFAYKLSEIIVNNTNVSNLVTLNDNVNVSDNTNPINTYKSGEPAQETASDTTKFDRVLGNVTTLLNTGIGAFGAWQQARSARDMSNWQYQRDYYERLNKEKQNRNILIIAALVIIAIIIIVVVRKY